MVSSCTECSRENDVILTICPECGAKTQVVFQEISDLKIV